MSDLIRDPFDVLNLLATRDDSWPETFSGGVLGLDLRLVQMNTIFLTGLMSELEEDGLVSCPWRIGERGKPVYASMRKFNYSITREQAIHLILLMEAGASRDEEEDETLIQ